ncbi:hypothetical protein LTR66_001571 [Elasticomyces elasticus]|nr:hypothetical protein LTR66_001571 [Elasticomyces elasticus]
METTSSYQQLGSREIRVLMLEPGDASDRLVCRLGTWPLSAENDYEALSYTWGGQTPDVPIECDGCQVLVTRNLDIALRHFRHQYAGVRKLWVDAICIDQSNLKEREAQVSIMKAIYHFAKTVLIWIGEAGPEGDIAFEALHRIRQDFRDELPDLETLLDGHVLEEYTAIHSYFGHKSGRRELNEPFSETSMAFSSSTAPWDALRSLLHREYFSRVWIIQEIALGRQLIMHCGSHSIDYDIFVLLWDYCSFLINHKSSGKWRYLFPRVHSLQMCRLGVNRGEPISLPYLLAFSKAAHSTDPRDKVYAMIGLYSWNSPRIDYAKHEALVFGTAALHCLGAQPPTNQAEWPINPANPAVLSFMGPTEFHAEYDVPSWIPDLTSRNGNYRVMSSIHAGNVYCAGGSFDFKAEWNAEEAPNIVVMKGYTVGQVDAVAEVEPPLSESWIQEPWGQDMVPQLIRWKWKRLRNLLGFMLSGQPNQPYESLHRTSWSMLIGDLTETFQKATNEFLYSCSDYLDLVPLFLDATSEQNDEDTSETLAQQALEGSSLQSRMRMLELVERLGPMMDRVEAAFDLWLERKLGRLLSGHLVWLPRCAEIRDKVCIFAGAKWATALRPDGDDHYKILGDAYVHGMMFGEVMPKRVEELQDIRLR